MKEERPPPFYRESTRFTHKTRFELVIVSSNRESIKNKELGNHWGCPLSGCAIYYYIYLSLSRPFVVLYGINSYCLVSIALGLER